MSMKHTQKMKRLLERMSQIMRMERGKLCQMPGRPHFNHQTWREGRNVVRYVPAEQVAYLSEALEGYKKFTQLAQEYAEEVIKQTRQEREKLFPLEKQPKNKTRPGRPRKTKDKKNEI